MVATPRSFVRSKLQTSHAPSNQPRLGHVPPLMGHSPRRSAAVVRLSGLSAQSKATPDISSMLCRSSLSIVTLYTVSSRHSHCSIHPGHTHTLMSVRIRLALRFCRQNQYSASVARGSQNCLTRYTLDSIVNP